MYLDPDVDQELIDGAALVRQILGKFRLASPTLFHREFADNADQRCLISFDPRKSAAKKLPLLALHSSQQVRNRASRPEGKATDQDLAGRQCQHGETNLATQFDGS